MNSFVGITSETIKAHKTSPIGIDLEHGAEAPNAASICRPIKGVARQDQSGPGINSINVGPRRSRDGSENMKVRETRAIRIDGKDRPNAPAAAGSCRPIKGVAR